MRLIADSGVLAAYVAVFYPVGLLDETPTVLGLRTFALTGDGVVRRRGAGALAAGPASRRLQSSASIEPASTGRSSRCRWRSTPSPGPRSPRRAAAGAPSTPSTRSMLDTAARAGIDEIAAASTDGIRERSCAGCAPRCGAGRSPGWSTCRPVPRSPRSRSGSSRGGDRSSVLRDRPVDPAHHAARSRAWCGAKSWTLCKALNRRGDAAAGNRRRPGRPAAGEQASAEEGALQRAVAVHAAAAEPAGLARRVQPGDRRRRRRRAPGRKGRSGCRRGSCG